MFKFKGKTFGEFMSQKREVDRWFVVTVGVVGAFCGSLLTLAFTMLGFIKF
jgi:hypothetical protein